MSFPTLTSSSKALEAKELSCDREEVSRDRLEEEEARSCDASLSGLPTSEAETDSCD